tara:strand:- start:2833 stop:3084 length:252 start_codon:yes stop_codon:yes gene_type:complete
MRRKKSFKKRKPKEELPGLQVKVYNNNVEAALKIFKKKVKNSGLMLDLKKKTYYEKPSKIKREKKALQKARYRYKSKKENSNF